MRLMKKKICPILCALLIAGCADYMPQPPRPEDEVRVADAARSADWIAAQYDSMTDAFITFSPEENL
jgi:hypothetical protein